MDLRYQVKRLLKMCGHAFSITVHERLDVIEQQTSDNQAVLLQAAIHTVETLHDVSRTTVVETNDDQFNHPEIGLMEFLYSYLPSHQAIYLGPPANRIPECLRSSGYDVHGFESVGALRQSEVTCADGGLVAAEPDALAAIRDLAGFSCPVVAVGFKEQNLDGPVAEMRGQGYRWHIVLYRLRGRDEASYYSNHGRSLPNSRGHIFFFREYAVFSEAQAWCAAVLPRTYFRPVPARRNGDS